MKISFTKRWIQGIKASALAVAVVTGTSVAVAAPMQRVGDIQVLGNPKAPVSGTFYIGLAAEPATLNPLTSTDAYSSDIQAYVMDGLMALNPDTYEWMPGLAEKVEEGKDGMSYTFYLRKDAKWHDGKPVTAEDVKFSYDAIMDPEFKTAHVRPYFENIAGAKVIDKHTIRFDIKQKYFNNFNVLASNGFMAIVPKHIYKDPKKKINKTITGSGPYKLEKYDRGRSLTLVRNPDWWGFKHDYLKARYKPERIFFRFVKDEDLRLRMLGKGDLDFDTLTPESFVKKTKGSAWGKTVLKKQVENQGPKGYLYVGWNLLNPLFKDRDVRIALAHLMNRDMIINKFEYGMYLPATGPWYQQNPYAAQDVKPITFDTKKAIALLNKAGWKDSNKDGVLDKTIDGKRVDFRFTLMIPNKDREKYVTLYQQDLKKAGIDMSIKVIEWNSFIAALDEKKFEAVMLAWSGGSVDVDPKQIWHSDATQAGGSNFISYKNPEVDKLIEQGRAELDREKRIKIFQKVYKQIAEDAPYLFLINPKYALYAHNKKMEMEKPTYRYDLGLNYWWISK